MGILLAVQGAVSQGVLWGIMAIGVYLTFRILDVADLSVDGSFATGGSICAVMIVNGMNPLLAVLLATAGGVVAGFVTGVLHTKCAIPAILAGIPSICILWDALTRLCYGWLHCFPLCLMQQEFRWHGSRWHWEWYLP